LSDAGFDFKDFNNILDLGCGVGRFMFAFKDELRPQQKIWGCDVHKECADWCRRHIDFAETAHTSIDPPLPYDSSKFNLVYALSVYTHLRLDMQFQWAWEIHRVLRPGGVLFVTTHGSFFFPEFFESYRAGARCGELYTFGDNSMFAYLSFNDSKRDEGQVHVAAAHTPNFLREQFAAFDVVKHYPQSVLCCGQDCYIIRKPEHGRPIERPVRQNKGPEQWCWQEAADAAGGRPVHLRFDLDGHQKFHVYPSVHPPGNYGIACHVKICAGRTTLVDQTVPFNNNRIFGKFHHAVIDLPVPASRGEVNVELSSEVTDRGTLLIGQHPEVRWSFPNFT
jgi:SAM-dependent methyltransferase